MLVLKSRKMCVMNIACICMHGHHLHTHAHACTWDDYNLLHNYLATSATLTLALFKVCLRAAILTEYDLSHFLYTLAGSNFVLDHEFYVGSVISVN